MARPSPVRSAVRERLHGAARHGWTIEDLQHDLHAAGVPADYSSVFRSLVWMEAQGEAQRVDLGDGHARWEGPGAHHDHVHCEACGSVGAVPGCIVADAAADIERRTGFQVQAHRLVLTGLCPRCQERR